MRFTETIKPVKNAMGFGSRLERTTAQRANSVFPQWITIVLGLFAALV